MSGEYKSIAIPGMGLYNRPFPLLGQKKNSSSVHLLLGMTWIIDPIVSISGWRRSIQMDYRFTVLR